MRLLIVAYYFPPYNTIGAVRVGKTAALLAAAGHDVHVLTARDQPLQPTLDVEFDEARITRTAWCDVNAPITWALGGRRRVAAEGYAPRAARGSWLRRLGGWYKSLVNLPDGQIGWLPWALSAGRDVIERARPDLILASALPPTALWVAARLARRYDIPWVAELRDLWVDDPSYAHPAWRRWLEERLQRELLSSARGLVTVSEPLAEHLRSSYDKPTAVILNGYDMRDHQRAAALARDAEHPRSSDRRLTIAYTGMLYAGRRNPEPLFQALALMGDDASRIHVEFTGRYLHEVEPLARRHGVGAQITVQSTVPYLESLARQQRADVLLLLTDSDPAQRGVFTGKLFEYLAARRPLLVVGGRDNVAAQLVEQRQVGFVSDDPRRIAEQLRRWLREKEQRGRLAEPPPSARDGLSRQEQVSRLDGFLRALVNQPACRPAERATLSQAA